MLQKFNRKIMKNLTAAVESLVPIVAPRKLVTGGVSTTSSFNPSQPRIGAPTFQEHIEDIFDLRLSQNQNDILERLFREDPDLSSTVNAYLTIANTEPHVLVFNAEGEIDTEGLATAHGIIETLTSVRDYSQGFQMKSHLKTTAAAMRYMLLLRGACANELVLDKARLPFALRTIDTTSLLWEETTPGAYKPYQNQQGGDPISLDYPTIFYQSYHQNPTSPYSFGNFSAAINTIAARQHVINTLYRIMNVTGTPRLKVKILEEVLMNSASQGAFESVEDRNNFIRAQISAIAGQISSLRPDQALIHTDSMEPAMLEGRSGAELRIKEVIDTLNDQNQAALKTMKTIIGRGESGVNTGSTEARVFSMSADELNHPVSVQLSNILTLAIRLQGYDGRVEVKFAPSEMRPLTELEPQLSIRQSRLLRDLSYGLITDLEYHLKMYNRPPPAGAPALSGTGFYESTDEPVGAGDVSANSDPLGRSLTPEGSEAVEDNKNS